MNFLLNQYWLQGKLLDLGSTGGSLLHFAKTPSADFHQGDCPVGSPKPHVDRDQPSSGMADDVIEEEEERPVPPPLEVKVITQEEPVQSSHQARAGAKATATKGRGPSMKDCMGKLEGQMGSLSDDMRVLKAAVDQLLGGGFTPPTRESAATPGGTEAAEQSAEGETSSEEEEDLTPSRAKKSPMQQRGISMKFGGDAEQLAYFITQVRIYMEGYGGLFRSEEEVSYVSSFFEGTAAEWVVGLHRAKDRALRRLEDFMAALCVRFEDPCVALKA
ncbi:uncharacterized protein PHA67_004358 isoform 1-T1 [Liasis olivaceus]